MQAIEVNSNAKTELPERRLARGTIYNMGAKFTYLICGYGIFVMVGRIFGPRDLGVFGIVFATLNIVFLFLRNGVPQAAAKHIGGDPGKAASVLAKALTINLIWSLFLFIAFLVGSEIIASNFLKDGSLEPFLRLGALTIIPVALYNVLGGSLLGVRDFKKEAIGTAFTSMARIGFVVVFILFGLGVQGVILAYALAPLSGAALMYAFCKFPKSGYRLSTSAMVSFAIPLIINGGTVTLLLSIDSVLVKRITGSDELVGLYFAAASAAHGLYHVFSAFGVTLLPSIAGSSARRDMRLTRKYIYQAIRYNMVLSVPVAALICGSSQALMQLLYGGAFISAGRPFTYLVLGALFLILSQNTIMCITALGRPWIGPAFYALGIVCAVPLLFTLINRYGIDGAGIAMALACFFCLTMSVTYIQLCFAGTVEWISMIRILISAVVIYGASVYFPVGGLMLFPWYSLLLIVYCVLIWGLGEWGKEDTEVLKGLLLSRRRAPA
jgi:O-antigen/teichoic acid export membrane protein